MTTPRVSIIVPAHGHSGMTENCVSSVLRSLDHRDDVELIVLDDASNPPIELRATSDARLRLERSTANLQFSGACNAGARLARGALLVFLNSDTEVRGAWLDAMLACLEEHLDVGIVGARLAYRDGTTQHAGMYFSLSDGLPRHLYRGFPIDHPAVQRDRDVQSVTGACMLIPKALFDEIGGFDVGFANGFEDVDLCLRARALGKTIVSCGRTDITHLESVSLRSADNMPAPGGDNADLFVTKWGSINRDEIEHYIADDLIRIPGSDVYPLTLEVAPELALPPGEEVSADVARLLNIRARQVFDLEKTVGYLSAKLLDHGIEP